VARDRLQGEQRAGDIDVKDPLVIRAVDLDDRGGRKHAALLIRTSILPNAATVFATRVDAVLPGHIHLHRDGG
jgi:hypothetical protein